MTNEGQNHRTLKECFINKFGREQKHSFRVRFSGFFIPWVKTQGYYEISLSGDEEGREEQKSYREFDQFQHNKPLHPTPTPRSVAEEIASLFVYRLFPG